MKLLVLAGGFGTRLKTTVADVPKALAPVGGVPFLQLQLEQWLAQGVREFIFLLHHQADQIIVFLRSHQAGILKYCQVDWLIEPMPMDTGGAVAHAVRELCLSGDFLTTNADTWLGGGVTELMQSASPAMAVVHLSDVSRYGQVHFAHDARVISFTEKNPWIESGWINAGYCHLHAGLFKDWDGRPFSLERNLLSALAQNQQLTAVHLQTDFIDIGVPDDYHRFCRWVKAGRKTRLCN